MFAKETQYFRNIRYRRRILNKLSEELSWKTLMYKLFGNVETAYI